MLEGTPPALFPDMVHSVPEKPQGAFRVWARPGARKDEVVGWVMRGSFRVLKVLVKAPAVDGKANEALRKILQDYFDIPSQAIIIKSGHTCPLKIMVLSA